MLAGIDWEMRYRAKVYVKQQKVSSLKGLDVERAQQEQVCADIELLVVGKNDRWPATMMVSSK